MYCVVTRPSEHHPQILLQAKGRARKPIKLLFEDYTEVTGVPRPRRRPKTRGIAQFKSLGCFHVREDLPSLTPPLAPPRLPSPPAPPRALTRGVTFKLVTHMIHIKCKDCEFRLGLLTKVYENQHLFSHSFWYGNYYWIFRTCPLTLT